MPRKPIDMLRSITPPKKRAKVKVYVAGPWELRGEAARIASLLEKEGLEVTSSWVRGDNEPSMKSLHDDFDRCVETQSRDREEVDKAHFVVQVNPESYAREGTGGRHVEIGLAIAWGKRVVVYGARTNVFHYGPEVVLAKTDADLLQVVGVLKAVYHGQVLY